MRRARSRKMKLGWRCLLWGVGVFGLSALACSVYGPQYVVYGPAPSESCSNDQECAPAGSDWYCDEPDAGVGTCKQRPGDGGSPDAGP